MSKEDEYMRVIKSQSGRLQQVRKVAHNGDHITVLLIKINLPESMPSSELVFNLSPSA